MNNNIIICINAAVNMLSNTTYAWQLMHSYGIVDWIWIVLSQQLEMRDSSS